MSSIAHLLTQTVWVAPLVGSSLDYGDPKYGTACETRCRIDREVTTFRDENGNERDTTHKITTDEAIERGWLVWFDRASAGDESKGYVVIAVEQSQTPNGALSIWSARV